MVRHHRWSRPACLLPLLQVTLNLSISLNLTPIARFSCSNGLPVLYFMGGWARLKGRPVHLGIDIIGVAVAGVLWDILNGIGLGCLEWSVGLLSLAGIRIYVLASSYGPNVSAFALWGFVNWKIHIVTVEWASLWLLRFISLLYVVFIELWVQLSWLVQWGCFWVRLNILGSLNRHLQVFLGFNSFFIGVKDKAENIF
jgi:hypothetical protein